METINAYKDRVQAVTSAVEQEFGGLSAEQLNWKPAPKVWSVGQVLDHLVTVNRTYFGIMEDPASVSLPWTARIGFFPRFFGKFILDGVQPDRKRKVKTFPIWEATQSDVPADMVAQFSAHQSELLTHLDAVAPHLGKGLKVPSPASKVLVYYLDDALEILVTHEERHLEQARDLWSLIKD